MFKITIEYTGLMKTLADGDKAAAKKMLEEYALEQLKKQQSQEQQPPQQQNPQTSSSSSKGDKNLTPLLMAMNVKRESNGFFQNPLSQGIASGRQRKVGSSGLATLLAEGKKLDAVTEFFWRIAGLISPRRWRRR